MTRSDEAEAWFNAVYDAVQQIPRSRVTSYAHVAKLLGYPRTVGSSDAGLVSSPQVGVCLKHLPSYSPTGDHFYHDQNVPWQRVINSKGQISPRGPGGAARQASTLRQEGVLVTAGPLGELLVEFGAYGWFPGVLPSEADDEEEDASADEDEEP